MNTRTKLLLLGALVVFGLYGADQFYRSRIEEPTTQLTADIDRLTQQLQESQDAQRMATRVGRRMDDYRERALPQDSQLARSAYQKWLLSLLDQHRIKSASVDAAQPRAIELRSRVERRRRIPVGYNIMYSLRGQGTLAQWTDLLYDFQQAGHLHKIRSLTLNPLGSEGELDASLTIEVLGLGTASRADQLSDWQLEAAGRPARSAYGEFVRRNLFARGFAQALFDVQLKAITVNRDGQAEAWFQVDSRGSTQAVAADQRLPLALHEINVLEIQPDKVLIEVNRDRHWITLGQSVGEVCTANESSS